NLRDNNLPLPDVFLMPSYWHLDTMTDRFGDYRVMHLPPPIDPREFAVARDNNLRRDTNTLKILHIVGTLAIHDRNGTLDLLAALRHTNSNFSLTIHSQHELPSEYYVDDSRVTYSIRNYEHSYEIYNDYDAVIIPRRYGGLCLVANEALMSGLPVI